MINIVSESILKDKKVHFDTQHRHLHKNEVSFVNLIRSEGHYVIEDNTAFFETEEMFASAIAIRTNITLQWHQLMTHANNEIIQHLSQAAEEMKFTNKKTVSAINECEECALAKAHRIISRSSSKSETSNKSFYRITYDLIDMNTTMNKNQWISHIVCFEIDFHMIYTHRFKSQAVEIIIKIIHIIEIKYNDHVVFFRNDDERALSDKFETYIVMKEITHELSAFDTSTQNDHNERLKGILLMKIKIMRLQAELSKYLWSWIVQIADYIMNRTPSKKHDWKTSFEFATDSKSNLAHIIQYESKTYSIDKHISRREKMRVKAHIGFLVEYDSINIFNIWISSQHKIVRTRDVIFNEDKQYRFNEIDAVQLISEPFLQNDTLDISQMKLNRLMIDELSSESEDDLFETLIDSIVQNNEESEKNKKASDEIGYLLSSASTFSKDEEIPTPSSASTFSRVRKLQSHLQKLQHQLQHLDVILRIDRFSAKKTSYLKVKSEIESLALKGNCSSLMLDEKLTTSL